MKNNNTAQSRVSTTRAMENGKYFKTAEFLRSINASGMAKFFEVSK